MDTSTIFPFFVKLTSYKDINIPITPCRPPPPKSAKIFPGKNGFYLILLFYLNLITY